VGPVKGVPVVFLPGTAIGDPANVGKSNRACTTIASGNELILIASDTTRWTLAHELGHVLANYGDHDGGAGQENHVMRRTDEIQLPQYAAPIFSTDQVQSIYRSSFCLPA
jgi:hypothetical protein